MQKLLGRVIVFAVTDVVMNELMLHKRILKIPILPASLIFRLDIDVPYDFVLSKELWDLLGCLHRIFPHTIVRTRSPAGQEPSKSLPLLRAPSIGRLVCAAAPKWTSLGRL